MNEIHCPLCNCSAKTPHSASEFEGGRVVCAVCGDFFIPSEVWDDEFFNGEISARHKANISAWLQGKSRTKLDAELVRQLLDLRPPSVVSRLDNLLLALSQEPTSLDWIGINDKFRPVVWAQDYKELMVFIENLDQARWIVKAGTTAHCRITVEGWRRVEQLSQLAGSGSQCFVAMSFAPEMMPVYTGSIGPAITLAGYSEFRVDMSEHNGKIDDEIIAQIRRSRFIVADFTGHRAGVYFEAGFAKGLGLPVIWTCRKDDIDKLHFDIRQYNCLPWMSEDLRDFQKRLQYRIESILGRGPLTSASR